MPPVFTGCAFGASFFPSLPPPKLVPPAYNLIENPDISPPFFRSHIIVTIPVVCTIEPNVLIFNYGVFTSIVFC